ASADPEAWDELPDVEPAELARLYHTALALPGVGDWPPAQRAALVDAATLRYRDRLVDRSSAPFPGTGRRHLERLVVGGAPEGAVGQACAQFGVLDGPCRMHRSYVRRVLVVEEMLVQERLTLADLEAELTGATRPGLSDSWRVR
ncbi:MAG: hypothetical protein OXE83_11835, partial [Gammaproteobacteria bacterium]|nr:hypothetical protein [Gammaproteobacteria bacterium]